MRIYKGLILLFFVISLYASDCEDATTNVALKECLSAKLSLADNDMNVAYVKLMSLLNDKVAKEKLKKTQRAWLTFRDAEAEFSADFMRGGTGAGVLYISTLTSITNTRTKELLEYCKLRD